MKSTLSPDTGEGVTSWTSCCASGRTWSSTLQQEYPRSTDSSERPACIPRRHRSSLKCYTFQRCDLECSRRYSMNSWSDITRIRSSTSLSAALASRLLRSPCVLKDICRAVRRNQWAIFIGEPPSATEDSVIGDADKLAEGPIFG